VLVNGRETRSCLEAAVLHDGNHVLTAEQWADGRTADPAQHELVSHGAFEFGHCIVGQIPASEVS
jgi:xanthine dehydrogenase YagT iron-sulfur-binding subunit